MDSKKVLISMLVASLVAVLSILTLIIVNKNDEIEIKFDSMSASGVETIKVDKNNKIVKPKDPVREGYTFLGWFNGDEEWNFDTVITEPITLTAKWEKNEEGASKNVTVTFVSDNGDIIQTQSVKEGDLIVKPKDPVREGYTFIGWFNGNEEWDFSNEVIANISITAKFEKDELTSGNNQGKTFKVTFNSNGGSSVKAQNVKEGNKISKPNDPTRSGYTFTGWLLRLFVK